MTLSEACIRRPVMTTLITASLIVFGAFAYRLLGVAALPAVAGYNYFIGRVRKIEMEVASFGSDFLNVTKRNFFKES